MPEVSEHSYLSVSCPPLQAMRIPRRLRLLSLHLLLPLLSSSLCQAQEDGKPAAEVSTHISTETLTITTSEPTTMTSSFTATITETSSGSYLVAGGGQPNQGYHPITTTITSTSEGVTTVTSMAQREMQVTVDRTQLVTLSNEDSSTR